MSLDTLEKYIIETTPTRIKERYASLVSAAEGANYGVLDKVVVIDTETTGVSFNHDRLTQIAAARMNQGEVEERFATFVNPARHIPDEIAHLTGIHDKDVCDAPTAEEATRNLAEFVGDLPLVAHNAQFDEHFVTQTEAGASLAQNTWIDSLDLSRISLPRMKSHRLIDLVHAFDAPISTHRADADVEALCVVYRILLAAVSAMPKELIAAIADFADEEQWETSIVFRELRDPAAERFDLRRLRRQNVGAAAFKARIDADDLAADPERGLKFATEQQIDEAFSADGIVGRIYDDYEARGEQVAMAEQVNAAFAASVNLAVEAGTGVGKSMAYLLPAVMTARENNITVGVATKTNALSDQLINKELPLLSEASGGISYASLKGFSHYPCMRLTERLLNAGPKMKAMGDKEVSQAPALAGLLSFIEQSDYDDIDGLKIDYRAMPRYEFTTNSHDCLRRKCPFFGTSCFVHGARQRAEAADIVVTNQTMLFCDVATEGGLLPPIRYWVVDEAHGAEAEARRAFSCQIDADELIRLSAKVSSPEPGRNVFLRAERQMAGRVKDVTDEMRQSVTNDDLVEQQNLGNSEGDTLLFALSAKARRAGGVFAQAAQEFTSNIHGLLYFEPTGGSKGYDRIDLWINDDIRAGDTFKQLVTLGHVLYDAAEKLIKASQEMVGFLENLEGAGAVQRDIASTALACKDLLAACELILFEGPQTFAYSAHLSKKNNGGELLSAQMLNVGDQMNETLYARTHSVVFTSATMTIADSFDTFNRSMGLGVGENSEVRTSQLESSYDFDSNMVVYVVSDMPEPNNQSYLDELNKLLIGVHRAQSGSTLTLFTNRREMEKSYSVVQTALKTDDLRVVCQKWGVSVKGLRDDFLTDEHLSLFALKSFWEGFDAPGATLKTVIIPKLPFSKPTDPLSCERSQTDPQAWSHFVLPSAVLETKQAAGRLIRSSHDSGSLVLADRRLVSKGYGKVFLRSLPSKNVKIMTAHEVVESLLRASQSDR